MSNDSQLPAVAIVGMAGRFPGAADVDELWRSVRSGATSITQFSVEEMERAGVSAALLRHPDYVRAAAVLDQPDCFDAALFGISPREAELMDPQHRLFLECAWAGLEDAGYDPSRTAERIAVFAGSGFNSYALTNLFPRLEELGEIDALQLFVAVDKDFLPTLASYKLDLKGSSIGVQTACSTGLVAVHLACQSLLTYGCDLALAGASMVRSPHLAGYLYDERSILSPDGFCRPFDARAAGTVFGNGVGVVVLRRLEDALAAGDSIRAVVRGTAVNNDGATKVGFTAPGLRGQAEVIAGALAVAEVAPETIGYLEAHGTATKLGDPVEVAALKEAFGACRGRRAFCALGSVKANLGHLDVAAGIAGLIKAALVVEHGEIPPLAHFESPGPRLQLEDSPFYISRELRPWPEPMRPRRAGVSSFGVGGTNAHAILEEPPARLPSSPPSRDWQLVALSAADGPALERRAEQLASAVGARPDLSLADLAYTLGGGRRQLAHRRAFIARDLDELRAALAGGRPEAVANGVDEGERPGTVFLFPGQGSQYPGMGRELYRREPVFREHLDRSAALLAPHLGLPLTSLLFAPNDPAAAAALARTAIAQPALFAVEHALAQLWMSWGVEPTAFLGHSVGELVAACLAGTFTLEAAAQLVATRGRLMDALPPGAMLAVPLTAEELAPWLDTNLELAAVNGPKDCVVAGPFKAIDELAVRCASAGITVRRLHTSHAFHSAAMEPILEPFAAAAARARPEPPRKPWLSNRTGTWITPEEATRPGYWADQLRHTVQLDAALTTLFEAPRQILLELGPGGHLGQLASRHPHCANGHRVISSLRHARQTEDDGRVLASAVARFWVVGGALDPTSLQAGERRHRLPLPTYPFARSRHWLDAPAPSARPVPASSGPRPVKDWFAQPLWRQAVLPTAPPPRTSIEPAWLVLARDETTSHAVLTAVAERRQRCVALFEGRAAPGAATPTTLTLATASAEAFAPAVEALALAPGQPLHVVHLWALEADDESARRTFESLLFLSQALGRLADERPLQLALLCPRLCAIESADRVEPLQALVLGASRVVPEELPGARTLVLDADLASVPAEAVADQLLAELDFGLPEPLVALRGRRRWVQRLEPLALEAAPEEPLRRLRKGGTYLVTGGLGRVGLALAEELVERAEAQVVLLARRELPARHHWHRLIEEGGGDPELRRRLGRLLELEERGARFLVLAADVADPHALTQALAQAEAAFGRLHGVVHAAGVAGRGLMLHKVLDDVERVLAPKVGGLLALERVLADKELDFLVLVSSTLGLTGGLGQFEYAAANAVLDAFAASSRLPLCREKLVIDWAGWSAETAAERTSRFAPAAHPLLGSPTSASTPVHQFSARYEPACSWVLAEHRIAGAPTLPGVAYLEMVRAAFSAAIGSAPLALRDVTFERPLTLMDEGSRDVFTRLTTADGAWSWEIASRGEDESEEARHATGSLVPLGEAEHRRRHDPATLPPPEPTTAPAADGTLVSWGPHWQAIRAASAGPDWVLLERPEADDEAVFGLHPALLDIATSAFLPREGTETYLPMGYRSLRLFAALPRRLWVHRRATSLGSAALSFDLSIFDLDGQECVAIDGFLLRRIAPSATPAPAVVPAKRASTPRAGGLDTAQGRDAFARILAWAPGPQIVVAPEPLEAASSGRTGRAQPEPPSTSPPRPAAGRSSSLASPYEEPRDALERAIAEVWEQALGFDRIGVHDNFFELGGHSVIAIQLLKRIEQTFAIELPMDALFEAPTIAQLGEKVLDRLVVDLGPETSVTEPALDHGETLRRAEVSHE